jgi:hypothetical protein
MTTLATPQTEVPDRTSIQLNRLTGLGGLAFIATAFVTLGGELFSDDTPKQVVAWVQAHPTQIAVNGLQVGLQMCVMALVLGRLVWLSGDRGGLRTIALGAIVADVGVAWAEVGAYFGLADAGQRGGGDGAVMALFSLVRQMTFCDGFLFGVSAAVASVLCLRASVLPRTVAWLGVLLGVFKVVELPVQLAATGTPDGATGPVGTVLLLVWLLATSVTLLVRPRRG